MASYYNPSLAAKTAFDEMNTERLLMDRAGLGDIWERKHRPWKFSNDSGGAGSGFGGGRLDGRAGASGDLFGGGMNSAVNTAKELANLRFELDKKQMGLASQHRQREAQGEFGRRQQEIASARNAALAAFGR